jgi:hypothetical protein
MKPRLITQATWHTASSTTDRAHFVVSFALLFLNIKKNRDTYYNIKANIKRKIMAAILLPPESHNTNNRQTIKEASEIQESTKAALARIQKNVAITQEVGMSTLEELEDQQYRMKKTRVDIQHVNAQTKKTDRLLNRFNLWTGHWVGLKKNDAKLEASETVAALERDLKKAAIERERVRSTTTTSGVVVAVAGSDLNQLNNERPAGTIKVGRKPPSCQTTNHHHHDDGSPPGAVVVVVPPVPEELDEESKAGLEMLKRTDKEDIDSMLDEVAASLERLDTISTCMLQEIQSQTIESEEVTRQVHKAVKRKTFSNARIKRVLTGKWRNRHSN